jgi:hypothetical protein
MMTYEYMDEQIEKHAECIKEYVDEGIDKQVEIIKECSAYITNHSEGIKEYSGHSEGIKEHCKSITDLTAQIVAHSIILQAILKGRSL